MKFNPLLAVIACVLGLIGAFVPLSSSVIDSDFVINILITFLLCVLGLAGIFLFNKDYMIAMVQYVICGVGALFGMGTYALPSFVLFVIASIITFFEKEKSENFTEKKVLDAHFFGDESEIRERYNNFPKNSTNSTVYWIIPIVSIVLILLVGVIGGILYDNDMHNKLDSIELQI